MVLEVGRRGWNAVAFEIAGRSADDVPDSTHFGSREASIPQMADADGHVHPFFDDVDGAIDEQGPGVDGRIGIQELCYDGQHIHLPEQYRSGDGQRTGWRGIGATRGSLRFGDIRQYAAAILEISCACLGHLDGTGGANEQAGANKIFKRCNRAGDRRCTHMHVARGIRKTSGLRNFGENPHCLPSIHSPLKDCSCCSNVTVSQKCINPETDRARPFRD